MCSFVLLFCATFIYLFVFPTGESISTESCVQPAFLRNQGGARTPHPGPSQVLHLINPKSVIPVKALRLVTIIFQISTAPKRSNFSNKDIKQSREAESVWHSGLINDDYQNIFLLINSIN